jgi:hypothetical protein
VEHFRPAPRKMARESEAVPNVGQFSWVTHLGLQFMCERKFRPRSGYWVWIWRAGRATADNLTLSNSTIEATGSCHGSGIGTSEAETGHESGVAVGGIQGFTILACGTQRLRQPVSGLGLARPGPGQPPRLTQLHSGTQRPLRGIRSGIGTSQDDGSQIGIVKIYNLTIMASSSSGGTIGDHPQRIFV